MVLKDLLDVLNCDVIVFTKEDTVHKMVLQKSGLDLVREVNNNNIISASYLNSEVLSLRYSLIDDAMVVRIKPCVTNRDKLKELYPDAFFTPTLRSFDSDCEYFSIDDGTKFRTKWLDSPYNKEEANKDE